MASQVLSGTGNVSYTNNTGQNVRIVINYMRGVKNTVANGNYFQIGLTWANVSVVSELIAIGRNLAFSNFDLNANQSSAVGMVANNALGNQYSALPLGNSYSPELGIADGALPTELMLAPGQTFSASCGPYNIVVIPEAG